MIFASLLISHLRVCGQWSVPSHQVVEAGRGDQGRYQTNQVVVHVTRVTQRCGGS